MSRQSNTIQVNVQVQLVFGKKEMSIAAWEINLDGHITRYKNHGSMIVTGNHNPDDSIKSVVRDGILTSDLGQLLWAIAEKAVKLAKFPKLDAPKLMSTHTTGADVFSIDGKKLASSTKGEIYYDNEIMPVTVSITCDLNGKILSHAQG